MNLPSKADTLPERLDEAATEFARARLAFAEVRQEPKATAMHFYRLRDLALAALDLCRCLASEAGMPSPLQTAPLDHAMASLLGDNRELQQAVDTLSGLANAHVFAFMADPPEAVLQVGHAASTVVGEFLDLALGDTYAVLD